MRWIFEQDSIDCETKLGLMAIAVLPAHLFHSLLSSDVSKDCCQRSDAQRPMVRNGQGVHRVVALQPDVASGLTDYL